MFNDADVYIDFNKDKINIKDTYKGQTGLIICNGPSLEDVPLEFLKKYTSIGTNNIYLWGMTEKEVKSYPKTPIKFRPNFYTILGYDQINNVEKATYIAQLLEVVDLAFVNRLAYRHVAQDNIYAIHGVRVSTGTRPFYKRQFSYDIMDCIGIGFTNTYIMLQIMYYLGFTTVYTVGLDNDYGKDPKKLHFYNNDSRFSSESIHGREGFMLGSNEMFKASKVAYEKDGRKIININEVNNTPFDWEKPEWETK